MFNLESRNVVNLQCLVTSDIGFKPKILSQRFERLFHAFGLNPEQVESSCGKCELLIGVKNQSVQVAKIANFKSSLYPEVGIYQSPLLSKLIFVGADSRVDATVNLCSETSVFKTSVFNCQSMDLKIHNFLEAEKTLPLQDVLCDTYEKNKDCTSCKAAKRESIFQEMAEEDMIKSALQLEYVSRDGNTLVQRFCIE